MSENQRGRDRNFDNRQWRGGRENNFGNRGRRFENRSEGGRRRFDGERSDFGNRGGRFGRDDNGEGRRDRNFDRNDRGFRRDDRGPRQFNRDERGGRRFDNDRGYRRDDTRRRFDSDDRGGRRFERGDRDFRRNDRGGRRFENEERPRRRFDRDDRSFSGDGRSDRRFGRGERDFGGRGRDYRHDDRGGRQFNREDRPGRRFDHHDRRERDFDRKNPGGRRFDRDDRGSRFNRDGGGRRNFDSDRYHNERPNRFEDQYDAAAAAYDKFDDEFAERINQIQGLPIPEGLEGQELDAAAYETLATLGAHSQEEVAKLLVMAGQLIDMDPERAYTYAQAAVGRAGRVDIVREAAALTAYATERYQEALREVRAVRRMRNDFSLRAVEADCERGLGKPEKALELIDETDLSQLDVAEQVELVLVAAGARSDLGETDTALVLVEDALAKLGPDGDDELRNRLMSAQADHLRSLGRDGEADEVEASMPALPEDNDILDLKMLAESDVDDVRSDLKGSDEPLSQRYDTLLLDLDGVCYHGSQPVAHAAQSVSQAVNSGMKHAFVTNNSSRSPKAVAAQLADLGFPAEPEDVMTSAMDAVKLMGEDLEPGAKVLVIGGEGLREAVTNGGFEIVESADDNPDAVVQGLDKSLGWAELSEAAYAVTNGAAYYATNMDGSLPTERGFALGNGALVRAVRYASGKKPKVSGKPLPAIFRGAIEMVGGEHAIAIGDRLETDVAGALSASIPSMHVLTGVHDARSVILADRGLRPQLVHTDMRGLNEPHPRPRHHRDGTWSCGVGQIAKVVAGRLTLDGVALLEDGATVTLDSYRALIAAAWEYARENDSKVFCPSITVVDNDDPAGILKPVEPEVEEPAVAESTDLDDMPASDVSDEELAQVDVESVAAFLPGEEDLEELLEETRHLAEEDEESQESE